MNILPFNQVDKTAIIELYRQVFTDSEGEAEGTVIGNLVTDILAKTPEQDIYGYMAMVGEGKQENLVGAILLTRLTAPDSDIYPMQQDKSLFLLSPVAVLSSQQGSGIGQALINHGLEQLKRQGVDMVFTYGDPNYYGKVGFSAIDETVIKAPHTLSYPTGWIGQSLTDEPIVPIDGALQCVEAFNNPEIW